MLGKTQDEKVPPVSSAHAPQEGLPTMAEAGAQSAWKFGGPVPSRPPSAVHTEGVTLCWTLSSMQKQAWNTCLMLGPGHPNVTWM